MKVQRRNTGWAQSKLHSYLSTLEKLDQVQEFALADYLGDRDKYRAALTEANRQFETVRRILTSVLPEVEYTGDVSHTGAILEQSQVVDRAIGKLQTEEEVRANWPSEPAIEIDPSQLHPWVWDSARPLWPVNHRDALRSVAIAVNTQMQEKLGRDNLEFAPLALSAFSLKPPQRGNPRLRLAAEGDWDRKTYENLHKGAAALGDYVFTLWRNILAHKEYPISLEMAVEALAAYSTFARLVDEATIDETT